METLNLGIVAHVDAGKTSLTERLLLHAGVITRAGSVDAGTTQTDTLPLERQRGITIRSGVVSFAIGERAVNLIDTPGHPDFIAEVERALGVLDGAVLVLSAVEGVQAQTRVLMRTLQRLRVPTLLFVNKIDRAGARCDQVLADIAGKLTPAAVPMGAVRDAGARHAAFERFGGGDPGFRSRLAEVLAEHDDAVLDAYLAGHTAVPSHLLRSGLAAQTSVALVHPVFFGSALTGAGVDPLMAAIAELLPAADATAAGPVRGDVFKVERGASGEKVAYIRMWSGAVQVRDRVRYGPGRTGKVTGVRVAAATAPSTDGRVTGGQIALLRGLADVRVGDVIGADAASRAQRHFRPPTLEAAVAPVRAADRPALHAALTQLADQDPLINVRLDGERGEIHVSLYGEVQKEVIAATLADEFGVEVAFHETSTIHIERLIGTGEAAEFIDTPPNPFLATVGLRVEPARTGAGVRFGLGVEAGSMPAAFFKAVEETVLTALRQGLHGWEVTDCAVTLTHSGYWPRQSHAHGTFDKTMSSTAGDFRNLTPLVLMSALARAGTEVCEPVHRFRLELPEPALPLLPPLLARLRAVVHAQHTLGAACVLEGEIPAARVRELELRVPALTSGEGLLECVFDRYQPVSGPPPSRARTDGNPLNRKEYLLHVRRRATGGASG